MECHHEPQRRPSAYHGREQYDLDVGQRFGGVQDTAGATNPGNIGHAWVKALWIDRARIWDRAAGLAPVCCPAALATTQGSTTSGERSASDWDSSAAGNVNERLSSLTNYVDEYEHLTAYSGEG